MRNYNILILGLLLTLFGSCTTAQNDTKETSTKTPPNIIFIMADDLGYGDLGCYGQRLIKTPNIDKMAAEGLKFTQCYAGSTVCAPSRSVLMTGKHTGHTTVRGNFGVGGVTGLGGGEGRVPLQNEDTTIAELLQQVGYTTGMIGKWGLGEPNTSGEPNKKGFDEFWGFLNQRRAHTYFPDYIWHNADKINLKENNDHQKATYVHDIFLEQTLSFIKNNQNNPFFLYLPFTLPHDEYEIDTLGQYADSTHWTVEEQTYAAMVTRMDYEVGRILSTLKAEGLDDNTIVFFCSDNGAAQRWEGRFNSSGNLRGRKRDMYEGGIRTPMIVRFPKHINAGETSDFVWSFVDILPTLASIGGAKTVQSDGQDVSTMLLSNSHTDNNSDRILYWEFYEGGFQQAVRYKQWKGVLTSLDANWELYNLEEDVSERNNLADSHPEIVDLIVNFANNQHVPSPFFIVDK